MAKIELDELKSKSSQIPPNTHAYRREQAQKANQSNHPKVEPIVSKDKVVSTKKPIGSRIKEQMINENAKDLKTWFLVDVLVPGIKKTILDILHMMFYGDRDRRDSGYNDYRSYYGNRQYSSSRDQRYDRRDYRSDDRRSDDVRNIVLRDRSDAERVVADLRERIRAEGSVSTAVLADLIDIPTKYTDWDWGWKDPRDIGVRCVGSNKYLIDVAEPIFLK